MLEGRGVVKSKDCECNHGDSQRLQAEFLKQVRLFTINLPREDIQTTGTSEKGQGRENFINATTQSHRS